LSKQETVIGSAPAQQQTMQREPKGRSLWEDGWRRLKRNRLAMLGLVIIVFMTFLAIFAPLIAPYDPIEQLIWTEGKAAKLARPSAEHWFGTDLYGRDILSRTIYGTRISLAIAVAASIVSLVIGVSLGAIAGYYGGRIDDLISWLINVIYAFPFLLFVLSIVAFRPASLSLVYIAIGFVSWPSIARVVRGQVLSIKETEFVEAAQAVGAKDFKIIFRHILPNVIAPVIVQITLGMGSVIMIEASLTFLGFGTQPPTPSWGYMINQGREYLLSGQWWWSVFPGAAISLTVLGFNLLGDGLRDALDPRLNK
jgi:ABC-type dipeptide/oligopeptide/nickel transport system permease subunit